MGVWVRGDAGRLEQVLFNFNLLTNAVMHAPSARVIDVGLRPVGAETVLAVRDYGCGIAAEQLPHLVMRFYQVPRDDRPAQGGLRLGLFSSVTSSSPPMAGGSRSPQAWGRGRPSPCGSPCWTHERRMADAPDGL